MWPEGTKVALVHGPEVFITSVHLTQGCVYYEVAYWTDDGQRMELAIGSWEISGVQEGAVPRTIGFLSPGGHPPR